MADYTSPEWQAVLHTGDPAPKIRYVVYFDDGHVEVFSRAHDRMAHVAQLTEAGENHHIVRHEVLYFPQS